MICRKTASAPIRRSSGATIAGSNKAFRQDFRSSRCRSGYGVAVHRRRRDPGTSASGRRARRKRGSPPAQALGRSRGGFGSRIRAVVDALGLPVPFHRDPASGMIWLLPATLSGGCRPSTRSPTAPMAPTACMATFSTKVANRSFHRAVIENISGPTTASPTRPAGDSRATKLKQWRRIATRYDKIAANFMGFIKIASIMLCSND